MPSRMISESTPNRHHSNAEMSIIYDCHCNADSMTSDIKFEYDSGRFGVDSGHVLQGSTSGPSTITIYHNMICNIPRASEQRAM
jgi:hypothetical protein